MASALLEGERKAFQHEPHPRRGSAPTSSLGRNDCLNTGDVVKALSGEGYSGAEISHFQGSSIRADLNRICKMPKPDLEATPDAA